MSFQLNYNGRSIDGYERAVKVWEEAEQWRDSPREYDMRKLDGRKRHVTIRKTNDGSIACRLYQTDVVTYRPNGTITIGRWGSVSTDAFASSVLPNGMRTTFNGGGCDVWCRPKEGGEYLWTGVWRGWEFSGGTCTFKRGETHDWEPVDPTDTQTITHFVLDTKKAAAARKKYNYADFAAWLKAWMVMSQQPCNPVVKRDHGAIIDALKNSDYLSLFEKDAKSYDNSYDPLRIVRGVLYRVEDALEMEDMPYVDGYSRMKNIIASHGRW